MKNYILWFTFIFLSINLFAQSPVILEGYAYETDNRGFLNEVKIEVFEGDKSIGKVYSNIEGFFQVALKSGQEYKLVGVKAGMQTEEVIVSTKEIAEGETLYTKMKMKRQAGYAFEGLLAEIRDTSNKGAVDAIAGATIEIYNKTEKRSELVLKNHPSHTFNYHFAPGSQYIIMIRSEGFFTKRIQANIGVEGCIVCFEGMGQVSPGVASSLTDSGTAGTFVGNIELRKIEMNKAIRIDNIYYDYNSAEIREDAAKELDVLVTILKNDPQLIIELGSHTDSRGGNWYNQNLSQKRAEEAVKYIISKGGDPLRIVPKGYGETQLLNKCKDGKKCSDSQHQVNRRTEFKVVGMKKVGDNLAKKTLAEIIDEELYEEMLAEIQNSEIYQMPIDSTELVGETETKEETPEDIISETENLVTTEPKVEVIGDNPKLNADAATDAANKLTAVEKPVNKKVNSAPVSAKAKNKKIAKKETEPQGAFGEEIDVDASPTETAAASVEAKFMLTHQKAKLIPRSYNGYKIQFLTSKEELAEEHKIFNQFGNIMIEHREGKKYAYTYLLGDFDNEEDAESFMKTIITPRYPSARVVGYSNGKRKFAN